MIAPLIPAPGPPEILRLDRTAQKSTDKIGNQVLEALEVRAQAAGRTISSNPPRCNPKQGTPAWQTWLRDHNGRQWGPGNIRRVTWLAGIS